MIVIEVISWSFRVIRANDVEIFKGDLSIFKKFYNFFTLWNYQYYSFIETEEPRKYFFMVIEVMEGN